MTGKAQSSAIQTSESVLLGALLALAGGFMDAYSYLCRGKVFANAQTGNILLLGVKLFEKNWLSALTYALPVVSFSMGIVTAELLRYTAKDSKPFLHWRQSVLAVEMLCLSLVCWVPSEWNLLANSLISLACGMQVEAFRKIHNYGVATTMCIGNLRSGTEALCGYFHLRERSLLHQCLLYYGAIFLFVIGAIAGNLFISIIGEKSMLVCVAILFLSFMLMFIDREKIG